MVASKWDTVHGQTLRASGLKNMLAWLAIWDLVKKIGCEGGWRVSGVNFVVVVVVWVFQRFLRS